MMHHYPVEETAIHHHRVSTTTIVLWSQDRVYRVGCSCVGGIDLARDVECGHNRT